MIFVNGDAMESFSGQSVVKNELVLFGLGAGLPLTIVNGNAGSSGRKKTDGAC